MNENEHESEEWQAQHITQVAGQHAAADSAKVYAAFYNTLIENRVRPRHAMEITCAYLYSLNKNMRG